MEISKSSLLYKIVKFFTNKEDMPQNSCFFFVRLTSILFWLSVLVLLVPYIFGVLLVRDTETINVYWVQLPLILQVISQYISGVLFLALVGLTTFGIIYFVIAITEKYEKRKDRKELERMQNRLPYKPNFYTVWLQSLKGKVCTRITYKD